MLKPLEKYGWIISVVLFAALLVALFLSPGAARGLSWAAIGFSLAMVVGLIVQRRVKAFRQGGMTRRGMVTSLLFDLNKQQIVLIFLLMETLDPMSPRCCRNMEINYE
jgi:hypothetical protein